MRRIWIAAATVALLGFGAAVVTASESGTDANTTSTATTTTTDTTPTTDDRGEAEEGGAEARRAEAR